MRQSGAVTSEFRRAVYSQPENLRAGRDAFDNALREIDLGALDAGTIIFSGIGASGHALTPAVLTLRAAGRRAFAVSPGALSDARAAAFGDVFVLVSQSGASMETVQALEHLDGAPVVAITAQAESPLARSAWAWLPLGPLQDTWVATLSYTATLQALGMLCDALLRDFVGVADLPDLASGVLENTKAIVQRISESSLRCPRSMRSAAAPPKPQPERQRCWYAKACDCPQWEWRRANIFTDHSRLSTMGLAVWCLVVSASWSSRHNSRLSRDCHAYHRPRQRRRPV